MQLVNLVVTVSLTVTVAVSDATAGSKVYGVAYVTMLCGQTTATSAVTPLITTVIQVASTATAASIQTTCTTISGCACSIDS